MIPVLYIDAIIMHEDGRYKVCVDDKEIGIFKIRNMMRGNRDNIELTETTDNYNIIVTQNLLGVAYTLYYLTKEINPEYFL